MEYTKKLLRFNCPEKKCSVVCSGWAELRRHVGDDHHKVMCSLCTHNKKVFIQEHKLYTQKELNKHEKYGDEDGFTGHPECPFCHQRFYSADELRVHNREKHEKCHICERSLVGNSESQFFVNYDSLERHFRNAHFLCPASSCLEKKFVVFDNEIDLQAHQISEHPSVYGTSRSARAIDASLYFMEPVPGTRSRPGSSAPSGSSNSRRNGGGSSQNNRDTQRGNHAQANARSSGFGVQLSTDFGQPNASAINWDHAGDHVEDSRHRGHNSGLKQTASGSHNDDSESSIDSL